MRIGQLDLESFRNYKGFSSFPPKILDVINLTYYESENFSDSSPITFFNPRILGFLFSRKIALSEE